MVEMTRPEVGLQIRALREQRGLSMRAVSKRCGLSVNAISRIERGENSPTVSSLRLLAAALEVPIAAFFADDNEQGTIFVKQDSRLRYSDNGVVMESLASGLLEQQLEPFLMTIEPSTDGGNKPIVHEGDEFVFCLEGELDVCVGDRLYQLARGDSILFKANSLHWYRNLTQLPAKSLVVFEAEPPGDVLRKRHLGTMAT